MVYIQTFDLRSISKPLTKGLYLSIHRFQDVISKQYFTVYKLIYQGSVVELMIKLII
jgi:hypothetical protein